MIRKSIPSNDKNTAFKDTDLILDCETSGYGRKNAALGGLYLLARKDHMPTEEIFVPEKKEDEYDLLLALIAAVEQKERIITFNGTSFDIPLLKKRLAFFGLTDPFPGKEYLDLYLALRPLDRFLNLPDRKLLSYASLNPDAEKLTTDAARTLAILPLSLLPDFFGGKYSLLSCTQGTEELLFRLQRDTDAALPFPLARTDGPFTLMMDESDISLRVRMQDGKIRCYYTDIRNYEYLPAEGYAVHKTAAAIVAKSRKEPATRETCFTLYAPNESFFSDASLQRSYVDSVLNYLRS